MNSTAATAGSREADITEIKHVIRTFSDAWPERDTAKVKSTWDLSWAKISALAVERPAVVLGPQQMGPYYDETFSSYHVVSQVVDVKAIDFLSETIAYVICDFNLIWRWKGEDRPVELRTTFVVHKIATGWQIVHFHESMLYDLP